MNGKLIKDPSHDEVFETQVDQLFKQLCSTNAQGQSVALAELIKLDKVVLGKRITELVGILTPLFQKKIDKTIHRDALLLLEQLEFTENHTAKLVENLLEAAICKKTGSYVKLDTESLVLVFKLFEKLHYPNSGLISAVLNFAERGTGDKSLAYCFFVLIKMKKTQEIIDILNRRIKDEHLYKIFDRFVKKYEVGLTHINVKPPDQIDHHCLSAISTLRTMSPAFDKYFSGYREAQVLASINGDSHSYSCPKCRHQIKYDMHKKKELAPKCPKCKVTMNSPTLGSE